MFSKRTSAAILATLLSGLFSACAEPVPNYAGKVKSKGATDAGDATPENPPKEEENPSKEPDETVKQPETEPVVNPTPDTAKPDPVTPDPAKPDPVIPDPVKPDPVKPDPVMPDPTKPDQAIEAIKKACAPQIVYENDNDAGGQKFAKHVPDATLAMHQAGAYVCTKLYKNVSEVPKITKVRLKLRNFDGVAHVTTDPDGMKALHFSTKYIAGIGGDVKREIDGVLIHEVTHIWQKFSRQNLTWMTEGVADYVRASGAWYDTGRRNVKGGNFDGSYTYTGFFWGYLNTTIPDFVYKLNMALGTQAGMAAYNTASGNKPIESQWSTYQQNGTFSPTKAPWQLDKPPVQLGVK